MPNDDCTCPAVHVVRDTIISYVTTSDLARMKQEVKAEVAEALRAGAKDFRMNRLYEPTLRFEGDFAADRLSSPPAPKMGLPTMEDWKHVLSDGCEDGSDDRWDALARLIVEGKARIELLP